jgi:pimeloyl-ACP methyl ester carboxylesterase
MFSVSAPPECVEDFTASVAQFRPVGVLAMARASAEADLTDILGDIDLPTLLLFGDADVRAPVDVGERLHAAIPGSRLVVIPGVGHVSSVEATEHFNREVRHFLREHTRR